VIETTPSMLPVGPAYGGSPAGFTNPAIVAAGIGVAFIGPLATGAALPDANGVVDASSVLAVPDFGAPLHAARSAAERARAWSGERIMTFASFKLRARRRPRRGSREHTPPPTCPA
jgi:hypothetical protein